MLIRAAQWGAKVSAVLLVAVWSSICLFAHAVLVKSTPEPNSSVSGPNVPVTLTFNSRVDQLRSTLKIEGSDQTLVAISVKKDPAAPDKLVGQATNLKPGAYKLKWQVL